MKILLDSTGLPNYLQIEQHIKTSLLQKTLLPGDQLPSIRQLARDMGIAIITVKRAYDDLEAQQIIETRQGKGCFIRHLNLMNLEESRNQEFLRQVEEIILQGKMKGLSPAIMTQLLSKKVHQLESEEEEHGR